MKSVIKYNDKDSSVQLANTIKQLVGDNPVYFCIGSDKILADSIGPKVGTRLKKRSNGSLIVYGIEGDAINALNVEDMYRAVRRRHPRSKICAIDASLGSYKGIIRVRKDGLYPGSGVGKKLCKVGNLSILCSTFNHGRPLVEEIRLTYGMNLNDSAYPEPTERLKRLQKFIEDAADIIADAILLAAA